MKPTRKKRAAHDAWQRRRGHRSLPVIDDEVPPRPTTRAECLPGGRNAARPCPYVSCRYHLLLEVRRTGTIRFNRKRDIERLVDTCALDVADRGAHLVADVGRLIGLSRERVRQVLGRALTRVRQGLDAL
jgi:hypothetical protein